MAPAPRAVRRHPTPRLEVRPLARAYVRFSPAKAALTGTVAGGTVRSLTRRASESSVHPHGTMEARWGNLQEIDPPPLAEGGRRLRARVAGDRACGLGSHRNPVRVSAKRFLYSERCFVSPFVGDFQECTVRGAANPRVMTGWLALKMERLRSKV
jgi:hypothetical protein